MAKSPMFWIWIGSTAVASLANLAWARNPDVFSPVAIVGVNLLAALMTAVFLCLVMLRSLRTSNLEGRTTKD